jgi:co-chaperonin GroES (HSP10)
MGSQIISLDNEDYVICKETDIIGIVKWALKHYSEPN